jgi:tol-pal system protein YbgF
MRAYHAVQRAFAARLSARPSHPHIILMITRLALSAAFLLSIGAASADSFDRAESFETAQLFNRPDAEAPAEPDAGPDTAAMMSRIDRLERDLRRITGQNEELQHKVQVLEEQLKTAREPGAPPPDPARPVAPVSAAPAAPAASGGPAASPPPPAAGRRGDAFDPSANPTAPGAPKPLGTTTPSTPLSTTPHSAAGSVTTAPVREVGQPLDIAHGRLVGEPPPPSAEIAAVPAPEAAAPPGPKEEYEEAVSTLKAGKFEAAEKSLVAFLAKNGKTKYAPAATFNLGESYFLRGRHREAAEKYLEVTQKFAQSAQAPDALLRLGQSLGAMGAKDQACASFNEIGVKYPGSASRVRDAAQRESKKLQC